MDNFDIKKLLSRLCMTAGCSGAENNISELCGDMLKEYGRVSIDCMGNVICEVGEYDTQKKTLLLNAHIDQIGMIVSYITDDGFLRVSKCGGIDERVLPASLVTVYGKHSHTGVITIVPPHLQSERAKTVSIDELYVDLGMSAQEVKDEISLGDKVLFRYENGLKDMGGLVTSAALDDRACAAAIFYALYMLKGKSSAYDLKVLFSVQEEVSGRGAKVGAFDSGADLALVLDVSFGRVHGETSDHVGEIGKGAMIGISPVLDRELSYALINTAKNADIPFQYEVMSGGTGTDADEIAVTQGGIPTCTVSLPLRYMHTPVEAVSLEDIKNTAALISAFCEKGEL